MISFFRTLTKLRNEVAVVQQTLALLQSQVSRANSLTHAALMAKIDFMKYEIDHIADLVQEAKKLERDVRKLSRKPRITKTMFFEATGRKPVLYELERCNCDRAGEPGHSQCGWDEDRNLPVFLTKSCGSEEGN